MNDSSDSDDVNRDRYNGITCPDARLYIDRHGLEAYQAFFDREFWRGTLDFPRRLKMALAEEPPPAPEPPDEITFALNPEGGTLAKRVMAGQVIGPPHLLVYRYMAVPIASLRDLLQALEAGCQSASNLDPRSARNFDLRIGLSR